jgi:hypothetical protein
MNGIAFHVEGIYVIIIKIAMNQDIVGLGFIYAKFLLGCNIDMFFPHQ